MRVGMDGVPRERVFQQLSGCHVHDGILVASQGLPNAVGGQSWLLGSSL